MVKQTLFAAFAVVLMVGFSAQVGAASLTPEPGALPPGFVAAHEECARIPPHMNRLIICKGLAEEANMTWRQFLKHALRFVSFDWVKNENNLDPETTLDAMVPTKTMFATYEVKR